MLRISAGYLTLSGLTVILSMRTWVIWNRDMRIAWGLGIALVIIWIPIFFFLNDALSSLVCEFFPYLLLEPRERGVVFWLLQVPREHVLGRVLERWAVSEHRHMQRRVTYSMTRRGTCK